jgi:hypothetical protein
VKAAACWMTVCYRPPRRVPRCLKFTSDQPPSGASPRGRGISGISMRYEYMGRRSASYTHAPTYQPRVQRVVSMSAPVPRKAKALHSSDEEP